MMLPPSLLACALVGVASAQLPPPPGGGLTPPRNYPLVDNVRGTLVSTNAAPVRPLALDPETKAVWSVNTSRGTVERFALDAGSDPTHVVPVPWGPVSIARWLHPTEGFELLIVCRNTWGLLRVDEGTFELKGFVPLRAEPSDLVVDGDGRAFVSCMGADAVAQIDLVAGGDPFYYSEATHPGFRMKSPYFLALDGNGVLVAPLHSGNNTTFQEPAFVDGNAQDPIETVVRLTGNAKPLPDEDLFRIDPNAGSVSVEDNGLGTVLFAHGRHPADGNYWVLNTEAKNDGPQSEPGLAFDFVDNRVTLLETGQPDAHVRFDDGQGAFVKDTGGVPASGNVVGQPFALAFHPTLERTFVAGLLTDNVVLLDGDGALLLEIDLPEGSIPRGLALGGPQNEVLFVHCWGRAAVEVYEVDYTLNSATNTLTFTSFDPTPEAQRHGRELFYDGHNSDGTNVSCASCHVDAGTDFLLWNLSGKPYDNKGPMVTQTLVGLARVGPYHWRGERAIEDFNGLAFPGLLGGAALGNDDFEDFRDWLFSLNNPANPRQGRIRKVLATKPISSVIPDEFNGFEENPFSFAAANGGTPLSVAGGNGVAGMHRFQNEQVFQSRFACADCHGFPVGTNNDVFADASGGRPKRAHRKNAPFHELWRKEMSMVLVEMDTSAMADQPSARSFLGAGLAHDGIFPGDVVRFTQGVTTDLEQLLDLAAFIAQWDQGLGKAAHYGYLLSDSSPDSEVTKELVQFLLPQAARGNCDIAVFGTSGGVSAAWALDRSLVTGELGADDVAFVVDSESSPDTRSLNDFLASTESALFVGLPVGMAERFALDEDMDRRLNRDDPAPLVFGPGADDGMDPEVTVAELEWVTTNTARIRIETDEPTVLTGAYSVTGTATQFPVSSDLHGRVHNLLLTAGLRPSTPGLGDNPLIQSGDTIPPEQVAFALSFTVSDAWGNSATGVVAPPEAVTQFFTLPEIVGTSVPFEQLRNAHVVSAPPVVTIDPDGSGGWTGTVQLSAQLKQGPPPQDQADDLVFVVSLFRRAGGTGDPEQLTTAIGAGAGSIVTPGVAVFAPGLGSTILGEPGPFLLNDTVPNSGSISIAFTLDGTVQPGDRVIANIEAVVDASDSPNSFPMGTVILSHPAAFSQWDFPRSGEGNLNNDPGTIAQ